MFSKREKDIEAGVNELLNILNSKVDKKTAEEIFLKSIYISRISEKFDKERLKKHLERYAIHYFDEKQLDQFYGYLVALSVAKIFHRKTPSEVKKIGNNYIW